MAARKPRVVKETTTVRETPLEDTPPVRESDGESSGIDLSFDSASQSIDELLADIASDADITITVYKERGKGERPAYAFKCSPEDFSFDRLREEGGGDFRLYIIVDKILRKRVHLSVLPPKAPPPGTVSGSYNGTDVAAVMREGFAQQAQLLRDSMRPHPAVDIPALITAATGAIAALSQIAKAPPAPAPVAPSDPAAQIDKMLTMMQKGIELGQSVAASDEGGMMGLVRDLVRSPLVGEAIKAAAGAAVQTVAQAQPNAAQIAPAPVSASAPVAAPVRKPDEKMVLYHYVHQLVVLAASESPPALYADVILDRVPEETIRQMIDRDDWFDELCRIDPAAVNHRDWFATLRQELIEALTHEASPDLPQAGDAGIGSSDAPGRTPADT